MNITKLLINKTYYNSPKKVPYNPKVSLSEEEINNAFDFAYDMTFGNNGKHRDHRSGGSFQRKNGQIFANAFQGKLAEFGFKKFFEEKYGNNLLSEPDLSCSDLGIWDSCDFNSKYGLISIKSTRYYSGLLLLEEKDWDKNGYYIPNNCKYFMIVLVRLGIDIEDILKQKDLLYAKECDKETLQDIFYKGNRKWDCDFPGYIKYEDLLYVIENQIVIKKGDVLNKTEMDASNYYVQVKDLRKWP